MTWLRGVGDLAQAAAAVVLAKNIHASGSCSGAFPFSLQDLSIQASIFRSMSLCESTHASPEMYQEQVMIHAYYVSVHKISGQACALLFFLGRCDTVHVQMTDGSLEWNVFHADCRHHTHLRPTPRIHNTVCTQWCFFLPV